MGETDKEGASHVQKRREKKGDVAGKDIVEKVENEEEAVS